MLALEQLARELDDEVGTEALHAYWTEYLARIRQELLGVHRQVEAILGETTLPAASEEAMATFRALLRRDRLLR